MYFMCTYIKMFSSFFGQLHKRRSSVDSYSWTQQFWGNPRDIVASMLDYGIIVIKFELQTRYYVHLCSNTLEKGMSFLIPFSYGLNSITTSLLQG